MRSTMSPYFSQFKQNVSSEATRQRWFQVFGVVPLILALVVFVGGAIILYAFAVSRWRPEYVRWSDVVLLGLAVAATINALLLVFAFTQRRLWRQCSRGAAEEAQRWEAVRLY